MAAWCRGAAVHAASAIVLSGIAMWISSCTPSSPVRFPPERFSFAVLDVGQGLSQIGVRNGSAVVWDMGAPSGFEGWRDGYEQLGSPHISAIVISHRDMDHKGGMQLLPATINFDGTVIVSGHEDTAALRAFSASWSAAIRFRIAGCGDTLALLDGVTIECLWPPRSLESAGRIPAGDTANFLSLCFKVTFGYTSVCITGDIDSTAMRRIADMHAWTLKSDAVVVPHHGSAGALEPVFYGYVVPDVAILSCGINNPYGHPSPEVTHFLTMQMAAAVYTTDKEGHIMGTSNGDYWQWQGCGK